MPTIYRNRSIMEPAASDHSIHSSRIEHVLSTATADGKRVVHDELDFFADHHKGCLKETDQNLLLKEDMVQEKQLDVNVCKLISFDGAGSIYFL